MYNSPCKVSLDWVRVLDEDSRYSLTQGYNQLPDLMGVQGFPCLNWPLAYCMQHRRQELVSDILNPIFNPLHKRIWAMSIAGLTGLTFQHPAHPQPGNFYSRSGPTGSMFRLIRTVVWG